MHDYVSASTAVDDAPVAPATTARDAAETAADLRCWAVFIDAGYLYAAAGELLLGNSRRRELRVDGPGVVSALLDRARARVPGRILRLYWFDAARDRVHTVEQRQVARLDHVKVRLGNLNRSGQQKGVDAQIRSDLVALAGNRAITDAVLLAGDEDMVAAVEEAQAHGVLLHLWGVEPPFGSNQSERLVWEADSTDTLDREFLEPFVSLAHPVTAAPVLPSVVVPTVVVPSAVGPSEIESAEPADANGTRASRVPSQPSVIPTPAQVFGRRSPLAGPTTTAPADVPASSLSTSSLPAGCGRAPTGPDREQMLEIGGRVAQLWLVTRGRDNLADLLPGPYLPSTIDVELLVAAEGELGTSLRPYEECRRWLRDGFWARLYCEFGVQVTRAT